MKEPIITMMRVGEEKYKGKYVIECTYTEVEDGESVLDAETNHEVSMRITGPALLGLIRSVRENTDLGELKASQYRNGLIPCRYCGRQKELRIEEDGAYFIVCPCGARGRYSDSIDGAISEWNREV